MLVDVSVTVAVVEKASRTVTVVAAGCSRTVLVVTRAVLAVFMMVAALAVETRWRVDVCVLT